MNFHRKAPYKMKFGTLINYYRDTEVETLNWTFPIDVTPFKQTKCERLGLRKPEWYGKLIP